VLELYLQPFCYERTGCSSYELAVVYSIQQNDTVVLTPKKGLLILAYRNVEILNNSFNKNCFYLLKGRVQCFSM